MSSSRSPSAFDLAFLAPILRTALYVPTGVRSSERQCYDVHIYPVEWLLRRSSIAFRMRIPSRMRNAPQRACPSVRLVVATRITPPFRLDEWRHMANIRLNALRLKLGQ